MKVISFIFLLFGLSLVSAREVGLVLENLPEWVASVDGKVTVFADFKHPEKDGSIPLYVINRTEKVLELPHQDGDVYLKLEKKGEKEEWKRVQPHIYSWCGNSYGTYEIGSKHYLKTGGYQPKKGEKQQVRFSFYDQDIEASSNVGIGLVNDSDSRKARNDAMAASTGDFKFTCDVALGNLVLKNEIDNKKDLQDRAIFALAHRNFPKEQVREILIEVAKRYPDRIELVTNCLFYPDIDIKFCQRLALKDNLSKFGLGKDDVRLIEKLQKRAIHYLGQDVSSFMNNRKILKLTLEKFPHLKEEIQIALVNSERLEANIKNGEELRNDLPLIQD